MTKTSPDPEMMLVAARMRRLAVVIPPRLAAPPESVREVPQLRSLFQTSLYQSRPQGRPTYAPPLETELIPRELMYIIVPALIGVPVLLVIICVIKACYKPEEDIAFNSIAKA